MPRAICEDCGSLVDADLTHNGVCTVGHYVHCGWGHQLSPDELISDDVAEIIAKLEAKLAENEVRLGKAVEALEALIQLAHDCEKELTEDLHHMDFCGESEPLTNARAALAEIKSHSDEFATQKGETHE